MDTTTDKFYFTEEYSDLDSSFVQSVYYNEHSRELVVGLSETGYYEPRYYLYGDVPESVFRVFVDASSLGGYYNRNIKGRYNSVQYPDLIFIKINSASERVADTERTTYAIHWTWNGQEMPAHIVEASKADEAVEALRTAVQTLGLDGAVVTRLVYTATIDREVEVRL